METTKVPRSKTNLICIATAIFASTYLLSLQAQVVRDHRTKSQIVYFDEADAIFGKRTEIKNAHPTFKVTGKINTITITQNLNDGDNSIHKTKSGNSLYVTIKKGEIIKFGSVKDKTEYKKKSLKKESKKTYLNCTTLCLYLKEETSKDCLIICDVVDSSAKYNAEIEEKLVKPKEIPVVYPIPIPYPNTIKEGNNNPF
ncbi:hypothetical protein JBL43_18880 [Aureibaculum sp. A20]|uniref:FecR protein domain-containing protein n=1 Tax=Aureibaculum flavum TaxID=2795986 RepID=A0ABS0WWG0_9FLAO|nr:hypothetical protein [Aureibaculum flavum]MBJ2176324.1 hypothetical protein [Aureibaculum flavum]